MTVDPGRWKTASFKIEENRWNDFVIAAHQNGLTTTNVLEALIERYIAGEYPLTADRAKAPESTPVDTPESIPNLMGIHVLVLDDEINIRTSITSILEYFGAEVTAVATPSIALQTLQADPQKYQALISDIGMPEQDGWSFIRQVRALSPELGGKIPAAALTTYSSPREIDIAKRLGFQVHIAKPIDATLLASIVADLVK
jgi:two-component system, chemotaxis family, CheB/CheR fusion protein